MFKSPGVFFSWWGGGGGGRREGGRIRRWMGAKYSTCMVNISKMYYEVDGNKMYVMVLFLL